MKWWTHSEVHIVDKSFFLDTWTITGNLLLPILLVNISVFGGFKVFVSTATHEQHCFSQQAVFEGKSLNHKLKQARNDLLIPHELWDFNTNCHFYFKGCWLSSLEHRLLEYTVYTVWHWLHMYLFAGVNILPQAFTAFIWHTVLSPCSSVTLYTSRRISGLLSFLLMTLCRAIVEINPIGWKRQEIRAESMAAADYQCLLLCCTS